MAEYIKREDVINLITKRYENPEICTEEINQIPAADVVEVIRCKDCIHYGLNRLEEEYGCHCWTDWHFVYSYDFCSDGVRKKK